LFQGLQPCPILGMQAEGIELDRAQFQ
jgi:hypothetical protein